MSTEIVKQEEKTAAVVAKRQAWADVGEVIHNTELALQVKKESIKQMVAIPKSIDQIVSTETALKEAKQAYNVLVDDRKEVTNPLKTVATRLMVPEEECEKHFEEVSAALLGLKKQQLQIDQNKKNKENELKALKELCLKHITAEDLRFKTAIVNMCTKCYEYALGDGNIGEKEYAEYWKIIVVKLEDEDFVVNKPAVTLAQVSQTEFDLIWDQLAIDIPKPNTYTQSYQKQLTDKFTFYTIALKNKEASLSHNKTKDEAAINQFNKEAAHKDVAATLTAAATPLVTTDTPTGRALKSTYALDMEETHENGLLIIAGFVANYEQCKRYLKVKKAFELKIEQMANALVAIKNNDENFEFSGVKFRKIEKL